MISIWQKSEQGLSCGTENVTAHILLPTEHQPYNAFNGQEGFINPSWYQGTLNMLIGEMEIV